MDLLVEVAELQHFFPPPQFFLLSLSQQNTTFELPVTTPFQPFKPILHAGSWLESTLVQNNKIKNKVWFFLLLLHWNIGLKGLILIQSHSDI